jgi:hypothetical protein
MQLVKNLWIKHGKSMDKSCMFYQLKQNVIMQ